jgi:tRNA(Ile2) C34 agmatinyltransferase TiaS
MIPLICPKCLSKNTVYKGEDTFNCLDCGNKWKRTEIKLTKNPDLLNDILEKDKEIGRKNRKFNVPINKQNLQRRKELENGRKVC